MVTEKDGNTDDKTKETRHSPCHFLMKSSNKARKLSRRVFVFQGYRFGLPLPILEWIANHFPPFLKSTKLQQKREISWDFTNSNLLINISSYFSKIYYIFDIWEKLKSQISWVNTVSHEFYQFPMGYLSSLFICDKKKSQQFLSHKKTLFPIYIYVLINFLCDIGLW